MTPIMDSIPHISPKIIRDSIDKEVVPRACLDNMCDRIIKNKIESIDDDAEQKAIEKMSDDLDNKKI